MNIRKLIAKMTVEEKVAQLRSCMGSDLHPKNKLSARRLKLHLAQGLGFVASPAGDLEPAEAARVISRIQEFVTKNSRLGIPVICHQEALHGVMAAQATVFPQAIGLAATFDPKLMTRVATAIGKEARARGYTFVLTPVLDLGRDPRCGRTEETYGEDVTLVSDMGMAFISAVQKQGVACTAKHFAANFVADGGRDSHDIRLSEHALRELYFRPYEACLRKAGAMAVMPSYNSINGRPDACNSWLLIDVLRKQWGFTGVTGSDYWAIDTTYQKHATARDAADAAVQALVNGMDVEWPNSRCYPHLVGAVKKGLVSRRVLDRSVARVLRVKEQLGLFENPFGFPEQAAAITGGKAHRALALEAAEKSIVLLKNEKLLPLNRKVKRVVVIGPNAAAIRTGGYSGWDCPVVTPLAGIRKKLGPRRVLFAKGCKDNVSTSTAGIRSAVNAAKKADAAIICVGGYAGGSWEPKPHTEGEGRDRSNLRLLGAQEQLIKAVAKANRNTVVVLINGSMVEMEAWLSCVPAVINAWYPGCEGGTALANILFGEVNPGGRLPITFAKRTGQLPLTYDIKPTGRAYDYTDLRTADYESQAQFPFGHGLSYTRFKYSALKIRNTGTKKSPRLAVSCRVGNVGGRLGDEVVQLYLRDKLSSLTRPLKELKDYQRIALTPGEGRRVEFTLTKKDLSYLGHNLKPVFEPGEFEIMIGASSADIRLRQTITV